MARPGGSYRGARRNAARTVCRHLREQTAHQAVSFNAAGEPLEMRRVTLRDVWAKNKTATAKG